MADEDMPPKLEREFDSNLPYANDIDEGSIGDCQGAISQCNQDQQEYPGRFSDGKGRGSGSITKEPYRSLFSGSLKHDDEEVGSEENDVEQGTMDGLGTLRQGIGYQLSSQNPGQEDKEGRHSERSVSHRLGLNSSDGRSPSIQVSPSPSQDSIIIPPDNQPAYELRKNIERKTAFTYIDTDKSGTFDPTEEIKQGANKLRRAKAVKAAKEKKRKAEMHARTERIEKCIIKLKVEAFGNVRNCTNDEDNWPTDWSEVNTDCEHEAEGSCRFYRSNTPNRKMQEPIEDPGGDVDDLTGYPAARGCKSCRKHRQYCSLIEGGTYPCKCCTRDGFPCEPIVPPAMRGNCKQCFEDGEHSCSFEENPDQIVCEHCADNDYYCETLPPNGYKADRIDIYEVIGKQDRQHAQCTTCQQEKRRCSLKKMSDMPPCKYCKKNKIGCNFFHSPKVDHKRQRAATGKVKRPTEGDAPEVAMPGTDYFTAEDLADLEMRDEEMQSRYPTPEIEMEDNAGHKGILTKICTSFAHPIQFLTGEDGPSDCSFCEMPIFGVTGHYEREVHVIRWYNGLGFSEIGGGFCEENSCTRMCKSCTINRLQIILCSGHVLQPTLHDSFVQDFDALADELISADPGSSEMNYQLQRWCSMCFSIAAFGCVCIQPGLCGEEEMEIVGCGLRLCTRCEIALKQEFGDDIDLMAGEMEKSPKINMKDDQVGQLEGKVRADVSFLRTKGLLMNCVEADSSL